MKNKLLKNEILLKQEWEILILKIGSIHRYRYTICFLGKLKIDFSNFKPTIIFKFQQTTFCNCKDTWILNKFCLLQLKKNTYS